MNDSMKHADATNEVTPRRHHSGSMPIVSRRWLPALITSDNLPAVVRPQLPARRRKSDVVRANKNER